MWNDVTPWVGLHGFYNMMFTDVQGDEVGDA